MFEKIEARLATLSERAADGAAERCVERLSEALPGLRVSRGEGGVVIEGRRLIDDPRLGWIGSLVR